MQATPLRSPLSSYVMIQHNRKPSKQTSHEGDTASAVTWPTATVGAAQSPLWNKHRVCSTGILREPHQKPQIITHAWCERDITARAAPAQAPRRSCPAPQSWLPDHTRGRTPALPFHAVKRGNTHVLTCPFPAICGWKTPTQHFANVEHKAKVRRRCQKEAEIQGGSQLEGSKQRCTKGVGVSQSGPECSQLGICMAADTPEQESRG